MSLRMGNGFSQAFKDGEPLARVLAESVLLDIWEKHRRARMQLVYRVKLRHEGGEEAPPQLRQF